VLEGHTTPSADRQPLEQSDARERVVFSPTGIRMNAGARLREAREQRGLTLRDISKVTKIPLKVLDTIESNDITRLPPVFFTRAFVRAYAAEVGLDSTQVLDQYPAPQEKEPETAPIEAYNSDEWSGRGISQIPLLVLISLAIYYGSYRAFPAAGPSPSDSPHLAAATIGVREPPESVPSDFAFAPDGMQLRIHPSGTCQVSATADGRPIVSRLVQPGENVIVEGHDEIVLRVGDAGACGYPINGFPSRTPAHAGGAVTIRFMGEKRDTILAKTGDRDGNRSARAVSTSDRPVSTVAGASATETEERPGIDAADAVPSVNISTPDLPEPAGSADLATSPSSIE
jgi:transcriptional regulator with XRE-family HTH domain